MQQFEYKVVPAPQRGEKVRGAKTTAERFAAALMAVMNAQGRDGWEYLRADTLPCEERVGLTGKSSSFLHMLVFRRALAAPDSGTAAAPEAAPVAVQRTLVALAPEGAAPRVTAFAKPVAVPAPARDPEPPRD
jgi:hypothetical protein